MSSAVLIVPDVHEKIAKLRDILRAYALIPLVVFLGDFFDSWDGVTDATHETAIWLRENAFNPNYRFLYGNHDIHYHCPAAELVGPGFSDARLFIIQRHLTRKHWSRFRLHTWADDWLCSHAGWHPHHLHPILGYDRNALAELENLALYAAEHEQRVTALLAPGRSRGGRAVYGGVDWLDWDEFIPISGLNQIVGHTERDEVRIKSSDDSENYCIDTGLHHVAVVEDNALRIEAV